jgi:hypothetical protein
MLAWTKGNGHAILLAPRDHHGVRIVEADGLQPIPLAQNSGIKARSAAHVNHQRCGGQSLGKQGHIGQNRSPILRSRRKISRNLLVAVVGLVIHEGR